MHADGSVPAGTPGGAPAAPSRRRDALLLLGALVVAVGAVADVLTKDWAFGIEPEPPRGGLPVIEDFLHIHNAENSGAMWSLLRGVQREVWIAIRGGVFLLLGWIFLRRRPSTVWATLGFAFVLAGALGNLHDNVFHDGGRVRDWIGLHFWGWTFPIFNVADSMICVGAPLLLIHFYREGEPGSDEAAEPSTRTPGAAEEGPA